MLLCAYQAYPVVDNKYIHTYMEEIFPKIIPPPDPRGRHFELKDVSWSKLWQGLDWGIEMSVKCTK